MADFEEGGISWEDFLDLMRHMITPSFEGVIAEIVDNSLDQNAKNIQNQTIVINNYIPINNTDTIILQSRHQTFQVFLFSPICQWSR